MSLSELDISLNIQNNRDYPQQINVMGNPSNLLDTANAKTEYRWDVTAFTFTNENSVVIQYKKNGASAYSTFTSQLGSQTLDAVVIALNELQIGYFNLYTELGSTYIGTYNDNYTFGQMNIYDNGIVVVDWDFTTSLTGGDITFSNQFQPPLVSIPLPSFTNGQQNFSTVIELSNTTGTIGGTLYYEIAVSPDGISPYTIIGTDSFDSIPITRTYSFIGGAWVLFQFKDTPF